jgi:hypothetical protein
MTGTSGRPTGRSRWWSSRLSRSNRGEVAVQLGCFIRSHAW